MIKIAKSYFFDSAHQLYRDDWDEDLNDRVFGKCARPHGHTYKLTVEISGEIAPQTGMILNYFELDEIVKPIVDDELDHINLNGVFEHLTTAELMVATIAQWITEELERRAAEVTLTSVVLSETPKTYARWEA